MAQFLKVTRVDGVKFIINPEHITAVEPRNPNDPKEGCVLYTNLPNQFTVQETLRMLNGRLNNHHHTTNSNHESNNHETEQDI